MKPFKLSSIPGLLLLFISCTASLLMGCSGGGGVGGVDTPPVSRLGPESLAAGMVFTFQGDYENDTGLVTYIGAINKQLTITSLPAGRGLILFATRPALAIVD